MHHRREDSRSLVAGQMPGFGTVPSVVRITGANPVAVPPAAMVDAAQNLSGYGVKILPLVKLVLTFY